MTRQQVMVTRARRTDLIAYRDALRAVGGTVRFDGSMVLPYHNSRLRWSVRYLASDARRGARR